MFHASFWKALRTPLALLALAVLPPSFGFAAEPFPSRPLRMVVPVPAGGGADAVARMIGQQVSAQLGVPVVVDNRAGAAGIIGTDAVAKAAPDGHTVLFIHGIFVQAPALFKKLPYDIINDFAPVSALARGPLVLLTRAGLPVQSLPELVTLSKRTPGKLTYGIPTVGGTSHLYGELLNLSTGIDLRAIPYKGGGAVIMGLLQEEIDVAFADHQSAAPHIKSGKLKVLGITGERRFPGVDIPTLKEQNFQGFESVGFYGVLAPAGTEAGRVKKLGDAFNAAIAHPEIQKAFATVMYLDPWGSSPEEFAQMIRRDAATWQSIVTRTGIKPE